MKRSLLLLPTLGLSMLFACNPGKERRNRECGDWADWSNHVGDPVVGAVSNAEKAAAKTNEEEAAIFRRLAEGARKAAQTPIPFQDAYVKELATRWVKTWEPLATALDHQSDAWAKGDKEAIQKGEQEEMEAMAPRKALADEWMNKCHQ